MPRSGFPAALLALVVGLVACGDDDPPTGPDPLGVSAVEVRPSGMVLDDLGRTVTLEAVARDSAGRELAVAPEDFTWRSSNPTVATIDGSGSVRAEATGQVTVIVEMEGASAHMLIHVNQSAAQPVTGWEQLTFPTPDRLRGVWGSAPDDVWAVGFNGTILHYDGADWSAVASPIADVDLNAVWGSGPDDVWAVGAEARGFPGVILHYDGTGWTEVSNPADLGLRAVWGTGPEDVWVMGGLGRIFHRDGEEWSQVARPTDPTDRSLHGVWGSAPDDVWAVGGGDRVSAIFHHDGAEWKKVENPGEARLLSVWGSGPDDVWAGGESLLLHYDGIEWREVPIPRGRYLGLGGSGPNDVWAVGTGAITIHFDGTEWTEVPNPTDEALIGVWEMTPGDLWTVGIDGEILRGIR